MKKTLISFGDQKYYASLKMLARTALEIGKVDNFIPYDQDWLKTTEFWNKNSFILSRSRGAGYWIWKPYIILETFKNAEDDEIVMYSDAGVSIVKDLSPLYELSNTSDTPILFINGTHKNHTWTKRDCFVLMNCDNQEYWNSPHVTATFSLWRNTSKQIEFLKEWLQYLRDYRIVTDDPNMCGLPNLFQFREHRHDQSVLSLMAAKYKIILYRDPSQWGNEFHFANSLYPQLINHHRGNI